MLLYEQQLCAVGAAVQPYGGVQRLYSVCSRVQQFSRTVKYSDCTLCVADIVGTWNERSAYVWRFHSLLLVKDMKYYWPINLKECILKYVISERECLTQ